MKAIVTITALALSACQPAMAQQPLLCAPSSEVYDILLNQAGMNRLFIGMENNGVAMVEAFGGGDSEGFTIVVTSPNGVSCLLVKGDGYTPVDAPEGDQA